MPIQIDWPIKLIIKGAQHFYSGPVLSLSNLVNLPVFSINSMYGPGQAVPK